MTNNPMEDSSVLFSAIKGAAASSGPTATAIITIKIAEQLKTAHIAVSRVNTGAPPVSRTRHQRIMSSFYEFFNIYINVLKLVCSEVCKRPSYK